jgi:hypothetical protein
VLQHGPASNAVCTQPPFFLGRKHLTSSSGFEITALFNEQAIQNATTWKTFKALPLWHQGKQMRAKKR